MTDYKISDQLTLTLYDSIKALPAVRYQEAKQYEVMDAELGGGEQRLLQDLDKLELFATTGQLDSFRELKNNLKLGRLLTLDKYQPGQLHWACHVYAANGVVVDDYSEDKLIRLIDDWSALGLTQALIEHLLDDVKKNSRLS